MPAPYSVDLRKRVVAAWPDETTYESIAEQFSVGVASVNRWLQKKRKTGSVEPDAHAGGPARRIDSEGEKLLLLIVEQMGKKTLFATERESDTTRLLRWHFERLGLETSSSTSSSSTKAGSISA